MFKEKPENSAARMLEIAKSTASLYGSEYSAAVERIKEFSQQSIFRSAIDFAGAISHLVGAYNPAADRFETRQTKAPILLHLLAQNYELLEDFDPPMIEFLKNGGQAARDEAGNNFLFYVYRGFNLRENISAKWMEHFLEAANGSNLIGERNMLGVSLAELAIQERNFHFIRFLLDNPELRFDCAAKDSSGRNLLHHLAMATQNFDDDQSLLGLIARQGSAFESMAQEPDAFGATPCEYAVAFTNHAFLRLLSPHLQAHPDQLEALCASAQEKHSETFLFLDGLRDMLDLAPEGAPCENPCARPPGNGPTRQSEAAAAQQPGAFNQLIIHQALESIRALTGLHLNAAQIGRLRERIDQADHESMAAELSAIAGEPPREPAKPAE